MRRVPRTMGMMIRSRLVFQHACLWAVPTTVYGLLAGGWGVAKVDGVHWPDIAAGALWSGGVMLLLGAVVGGLSAIPPLLSTAMRRSARPARWAGAAQSLLLVLLTVWLYLNHQLTLKTDEAMTVGALRFLLSNPKEVMDMVWRFEGYHLIGLIVSAMAAFTLLFVGLRRLNERLLIASGSNAGTGERRGILTAVLSRCRPGRPIGIAMVILVALPAVLLGVQLAGYPSRSLITTAQVFPPLRAIHMTRWLTAPIAPVAAPPPRGRPIIDRRAYVASAKVDRSLLRNVLLVLLESVPAKALHCYGYARELTPAMDRLAADGVQFDRCYAAASFSSYSQISTFTSLYMLRAEENDHFADTSFPHVCLHDVLRWLGYETTVFSSGNEAWDRLEDFYPPETFDVYYSHNHSDVHKTDCNRMDDKYAMGEFARWLRSRRGDRPFYSYINLQGTHFNYEVPEPWASRYQPVPPLYSNGDGIIHIPADVLPLLKNQYDNALTYVDHWVGFIRKELERAGQLDRSILVLVGDHGEGFMEHGLARHGMHLWNEMIHVPLLMLAPGLLEPRRFDQDVSQIDIPPTVLGLMGLPPHPAWQGVDVLADDYLQRSRPVFSVLQLTRYQEAVVWGNTKYIADLNTRQEWLFDLTQDPGETRNLADASSPSPLLRQVRRMLGKWHEYQLAYYADKARRRTHYVGMPSSEPGDTARR